MIINGHLKFITTGSGELQNVVMERLSTVARNALTGVAGQIIYNITTNAYNYYDGTNWIIFATGGNTAGLQTEIDAIETSLGNLVTTSGTFDGTAVDAALGNVTNSTDLLDVLSQLDTALTAAAGVDTLAELTDVVLSTPANTELLQFNGTNWVNVAATSIGEFGFKTISGDSGSAIADVLGDTLGLIGATNGGITTVAENTGDTVSFAISPTDLATSVALLDPADFLIIGDAADTSGTTGLKTPLSKILSDLDIVTATANGILTRTANDTYASRTITASVVAGDQGISLIDGNGIAGNPTIGLDIAGLTAEAGTAGLTDVFPMFDGTNNVKLTLSQLNTALIASGTAINDLTDVTITAVADADFLVYDTATVAWVNESGATARTSLDVYSTSQADTNFVNVVGDTMSGNLNMGTNSILSVAAPTNDTDAANKIYVDSLVNGLTWKNSVTVSSESGVNINLATGGLLTIDGVLLSAGQRVLVQDQTAPAENGIYDVVAGTWTRSADFDSVSPIDEINSAAVFVEQGTARADTGWTVTSNVVIVDTDAITFTQFNGANGVVAGIGLVKTSNTLDINMGAGIVALPSDEVGIDLYTDGGLRLTDSLDGVASVLTGAKLQVIRDGVTLALSAAGIKVADSGITAVQLNTSIAGDGIQGGAGTALSLDLKAVSGLVIDTGQLSLSGIPNTALTNSALTIAADTGVSEVADLGETVSILGGTGIDTVVSATNTVTANLNASIDLLTDVDTTTAGPNANDTLIWNGTNWVPGNPINSTNELTDVSAAPTVTGQVLVSTGTSYTPVQIQYIDTVAVAGTTWTIVHNLNQKFVNVTVYDSSDNMIIPQSVVLTNANTTTITFNTAITGTAVVMGINGLVAV